MSKKSKSIPEKKTITFKSPDVSKMQEVIIDLRTRIYISPDADPEQAKAQYLARLQAR